MTVESCDGTASFIIPKLRKGRERVRSRVSSQRSGDKTTRQAERQTDTAGRQADRQTDRHGRQADRHGRQTGRQVSKETRETGGQAGRQKDIKAEGRSVSATQEQTSDKRWIEKGDYLPETRSGFLQITAKKKEPLSDANCFTPKKKQLQSTPPSLTQSVPTESTAAW